MTDNLYACKNAGITTTIETYIRIFAAMDTLCTVCARVRDSDIAIVIIPGPINR